MEIDYERLYDAMDWEPMRQDLRGNDIGSCFDPYGWHKHGDRTCKLIWYHDDQKASCFVCGGFTLPKLVAVVRGCDEEDADVWLDQFREGHEQSDDGLRHSIAEKLSYKQRERPKTLPRFAPGVIERYDAWDDWSDIALQWAEDRGITRHTAENFNLRFGNVRRLPPKGIEADPYMGPAILIPNYWKGNLVGWQYRWLREDRPMWLQKYTNTVDFPKDETLFNYDRACADPLPIIVVESVTTVLWLAELCITSVATFGAKVTDGQVKLLRRFQQGLVFAPDNDDAANSWLKKLNILGRFVPRQESSQYIQFL